MSPGLVRSPSSDSSSVDTDPEVSSLHTGPEAPSLAVPSLNDDRILAPTPRVPPGFHRNASLVNAPGAVQAPHFWPFDAPMPRTNGNDIGFFHAANPRELRVIVQPPTHVLSNEKFNRPLVVLGPLHAAYYVVTVVDPRTGDTAELVQQHPSPSSSGPEHSGSDPDGRRPSQVRAHPRPLSVGVRPAPIPDGYDTDEEQNYYAADSEHPGRGYAVWTDLAIRDVGPGWKLWVRAMDNNGDPIGAIKTNSILVQRDDTFMPLPQPETFALDQMLWLQRMRRKYPDDATFETFKETFWYRCTHPDCLIGEVHTIMIGRSDADQLYRVEIDDEERVEEKGAAEDEKGEDNSVAEVGDG
ncbi:hypothetical protein PG994_012320 [Apiospora phragmitis]|uniref:Uncharacterized protein n=1 Tax=Apiospora phragmitis TaxID=2905665 RepID=A0ABR1TVA9_9PEZI